MKMLCAVTESWGCLCAFALRRRFLLAFLLIVCVGSFGVLVGLFWNWMGVGFSEFARFLVSGFLGNFVGLEDSLHCRSWLLSLVLSGLEV